MRYESEEIRELFEGLVQLLQGSEYAESNLNLLKNALFVKKSQQEQDREVAVLANT